MSVIHAKVRRFAARLYRGDAGVNQSAEVAGLVGVATAVTAGVVTMGPQIGQAIATFWQQKLQ